MIRRCCLILLLAVSLAPHANPKFNHNLHSKYSSERWLLTGIVTDEQGNNYGYSFLINRDGAHVSSLSQIIALKTNTLVFQANNEAELEKIDDKINWRLGDDYLKYNPINESWVFGNKSKKGFNLRYEGINPNRKSSEKNTSLEGLTFYSLLSNRTNGSIAVEGKDLFVTSKNAWIFHQWVGAAEGDKQFQRMMCRFEDDTGLDYLSVFRNDKIIGTNTEWIDEKGNALAVSQFAQLKSVKENQKILKLQTPSKELVVNTLKPVVLTSNSDSAEIEIGALQGESKGFCVIMRDVFKPNKPA